MRLLNRPHPQHLQDIDSGDHAHCPCGPVFALCLITIFLNRIEMVQNNTVNRCVICSLS